MATAILMASPYLHGGDVKTIAAQLTLRDGPEVLSQYKWPFTSQGVTHGRHDAHDGGNCVLIVLCQATNRVHWHINHILDVPEHDRLELVQLQQRTRTRHLYSQHIRSYMGSHGAYHTPSITCTLSRHYNANRFIAPNESYIQH